MGFLEAVGRVWSNYANFNGRARRSEYWFFTLFYFLAVIVLAFIEVALDTPGLFYLIFVLASFLPYLALGVRRLHDTDKSGWWYLLGIIPLGGLVLLIFFLMDGTPGDNRYGSDPKMRVSATIFE